MEGSCQINHQIVGEVLALILWRRGSDCTGVCRRWGRSGTREH
jgi:hypothetical protein